ncbi:MAG: MarR family transcriptional regulator [Phycisphaera sp.]|nr:MAG: MarR family transcriptional regulator [Phycisphaera sp.]
MPNLQDEIGKKQPFDLPEEEAYLNVRRSAATLESFFGRLFRKAGLSEATYNVLRILRAAGDDGRCWGEIRQDLVVPVPDVTRLIDRLEKTGLCERQRSVTDRRKVFITITPKGKDVVDRLDEPVRGMLRGRLGHMNEGDLRKLSSLLEQIRDQDT